MPIPNKNVDEFNKSTASPRYSKYTSSRPSTSILRQATVALKNTASKGDYKIEEEEEKSKKWSATSAFMKLAGLIPLLVAVVRADA